MNSKMPERGNLLVIVICVVALLFLISLFKSSHNFFDDLNLKGILRLPCGITVEHPKFKSDEKAAFPLVVDGYVNGCGWEPSGLSAGTAQIFDGKGLPVTKPTPMAIPANSTKAPQHFEADLLLSAAPSTDSGTLLLRSATGLLTSIPIAF